MPVPEATNSLIGAAGVKSSLDHIPTASSSTTNSCIAILTALKRLFISAIYFARSIVVRDGSVLSGLDIILIKIFGGITNLMRSITKSNPILLKIVGIMGLLAVALGPVLMTIGFMATGVSALMGLFAALAGIVTFSIAPFIAIAVAIAAVVALVIRAFQTNSRLRESFGKILTALSPLIDLFKLAWDMLGGMEGTTGGLFYIFDLLADIVGSVLVAAF